MNGFPLFSSVTLEIRICSWSSHQESATWLVIHSSCARLRSHMKYELRVNGGLSYLAKCNRFHFRARMRCWLRLYCAVDELVAILPIYCFVIIYFAFIIRYVSSFQFFFFFFFFFTNPCRNGILPRLLLLGDLKPLFFTDSFVSFQLFLTTSWKSWKILKILEILKILKTIFACVFYKFNLHQNLTHINVFFFFHLAFFGVTQQVYEFIFACFFNRICIDYQSHENLMVFVGFLFCCRDVWCKPRADLRSGSVGHVTNA
jgi:hypothetical protein